MLAYYGDLLHRRKALDVGMRGVWMYDEQLIKDPACKPGRVYY